MSGFASHFGVAFPHPLVTYRRTLPAVCSTRLELLATAPFTTDEGNIDERICVAFRRCVSAPLGHVQTFSNNVMETLFSVIVNAGFMRSLISPLQGVINALLNGQLVDPCGVLNAP